MLLCFIFASFKKKTLLKNEKDKQVQQLRRHYYCGQWLPLFRETITASVVVTKTNPENMTPRDLSGIPNRGGVGGSGLALLWCGALGGDKNPAVAP